MNYKDYFQKLIAVNTERSHEFPKNKIFNYSRDTNYYTNPFRYRNFEYNFVVSNPKHSKVFGNSFEGMIVELYINDRMYGKSFFNQLKQFKVEIEKALGNNIFWRSKQTSDRSSIYRIYAKLEADLNNISQWDTYINWQINTMIKFLEVLPIYTEQLQKTINYIAYPDDLVENDNITLLEGAKKQIIVNSYERDPYARERCIKYYGFECSVCGFNFEKEYGEIGKEFIHVHHLTPLSEIKGEYEVDPIKDLRPVCPNCHAMLHKKIPAYTIEELKKIIKE